MSSAGASSSAAAYDPDTSVASSVPSSAASSSTAAGDIGSATTTTATTAAATTTHRDHRLPRKYKYVGPRRSRGAPVKPDPWVIERRRKRAELDALAQVASHGHKRPSRKERRGRCPGPVTYVRHGPGGGRAGDGAMDGSGRSLGGHGDSWARGVLRHGAAFDAQTLRAGVPPVCDALPTQYAPVSRLVAEEFFGRPGPDAYEVVAATDLGAQLRECDDAYIGNGEDMAAAAAAAAAVAAEEGGGERAAAGGQGWGGVLSTDGDDEGGYGGYGGGGGGGGDGDGGWEQQQRQRQQQQQQQPPSPSSEEAQLLAADRLPKARREHSSFASGVTRFDAPIAATNYRIQACPAAHAVPDPTRYPLDDGAMPSDENPRGRMPSEQAASWLRTGPSALSRVPRKSPFRTSAVHDGRRIGGEPGQEKFYQPRASLARAAAQAGSAVRYELTRYVPRDAFPTCVIKQSEWGGPLAAQGQCAMGPGDYEAKPGSLVVHDEARQGAPFADTTTREPLFCQNPKMRTDQGFR